MLLITYPPGAATGVRDRRTLSRHGRDRARLCPARLPAPDVDCSTSTSCTRRRHLLRGGHPARDREPWAGRGPCTVDSRYGRATRPIRSAGDAPNSPHRLWHGDCGWRRDRRLLVRTLHTSLVRCGGADLGIRPTLTDGHRHFIEGRAARIGPAVPYRWLFGPAASAQDIRPLGPIYAVAIGVVLPMSTADRVWHGTEMSRGSCYAEVMTASGPG